MKAIIRAVASAFVVCLCAMSAGCVSEPSPTGKISHTSTDQTPTESGTVSSVPTSAYSLEQQALLAQYEGYFTALYSLKSPTDDQVRVVLFPYATPDYIEHVVSAFREYAARGHQPAGTVTFGDIAVEISGSSATVTECRDTSQETMIDSSSGTEVGHGAPGTKLESSLSLDAQRGWLLASLNASPESC